MGSQKVHKTQYSILRNSVYYLQLLKDATLLGYATVLFSTNKILGFGVLLSTFFNPFAGITGFLGILFSNLLVLLIGVHEDRIRKGLYGFNGLLVGLSVSLYHEVDISLIAILFVTCILLVFVTLSLEHSLGYFLGLPVLSLPFVIVSIILYLAFFNYSVLKVKIPVLFSLDSYFPGLPLYFRYYIQSMGGIFFQSSPWAGLLVTLILLVTSRIAFFLSFAGFFAGAFFHTLLGGDVNDLKSGIVGFNYILTAIAVGGVFLVPTPFTFLIGIMASLVSAIIASFTKIFLVMFNIPVLALPFVTVTLMFLYVARLLRNKNLRLVDFLPGSPENNLDYYKTRLKRFGENGLYIILPFSGKWKISQGYNGEFTHKDLWKESLDFMSVDAKGEIKKPNATKLNDYYTYGLPVLAPCAGRVVKIVNHLDDNPIGEMDSKNNWGNLVLLEHTPFLFSQVSHLQKDSILVKEGDFVNAGTKLGLAGNSGRSDEPHIHLHFQATPEIGSMTIPISFIQYAKQENDKNKIVFNEIPEKEDIVYNLNSDFNLKNFFTIAPGQKISVQFVKNGETQTGEWKSSLDFWGNRYLEDGDSNLLYFYLAKDYFACLDYNGKTNSALFQLYMAAYRVPFAGHSVEFIDRISYKYFSGVYGKFFKDLIHPFSDRVFFDWKGILQDTDAGMTLESHISSATGETICSSKLEFGRNFPGNIQLTDSKKNNWIIYAQESSFSSSRSTD